MDVHRQTCQACGPRTHNNIIVREPGQRITVFVRCAECEQLVARYGLESYYHHGKGLESYLRSVQGAVESGRRVLAEFDAVQHEAIEAYARVLQALGEQDESN